MAWPSKTQRRYNTAMERQQAFQFALRENGEQRRQMRRCECPQCGHTAAENRERQAQFACRKCGFSGNADWVAAWNIKEAGLALLAWRPSSSALSSSCQEPTEATHVQRCA
jgi:predicted RNA-binding Zn-ribbon protein involved in translation (DUF1610 family)